MVTRKQPRTRSLLEQIVWLGSHLVSLHALTVKHDGRLAKQGAVHMAAERADQTVMEFYQRFPK